MKNPWRQVLRCCHPEGIPWPATIFYNAVSRSDIFQRHYELVANDVGHYCNRGRLLDIGTGPGWLLLTLRKLLPDVGIVGVDISPAMVSKARQNIETSGHSESVAVREGAAGALPFADNSFDAVVSTGSIHHWKDPVGGLNEIHRVLKGHGHALIYDLVREMPKAVAREVRRRFGGARLGLLWLHSFEEPFCSADEMQSLARSTRFRDGEIRYVGALCCLILKKKEETIHHHKTSSPERPLCWK